MERETTRDDSMDKPLPLWFMLTLPIYKVPADVSLIGQFTIIVGRLWPGSEASLQAWRSQNG
jgi:hypothetical protein